MPASSSSPGGPGSGSAAPARGSGRGPAKPVAVLPHGPAIVKAAPREAAPASTHEQLVREVAAAQSRSESSATFAVRFPPSYNAVEDCIDEGRRVELRVPLALTFAHLFALVRQTALEALPPPPPLPGHLLAAEVAALVSGDSPAGMRSQPSIAQNVKCQAVKISVQLFSGATLSVEVQAVAKLERLDCSSPAEIASLIKYTSVDTIASLRRKVANAVSGRSLPLGSQRFTITNGIEPPDTFFFVAEGSQAARTLKEKVAAGLLDARQCAVAVSTDSFVKQEFKENYADADLRVALWTKNYRVE